MDRKKDMLAERFPQGFTPPHKLSGLPADTPILVGFSGGADSGTLLHLLHRYSKQSGAAIYAAHINHMIRGEEAMRDEEFCKRSAEALGIPFFLLRADVPSLAKERSESIELCARNVRYEFFSEIMEKNNIPILATAHNANDNLETLIFNLSRGSGLRGLGGIPPSRSCKGGILIRPILRMSRDDILGYCKEQNIEFVTDSTNADTEYTRNKIRAEIIPVLKNITSAPEQKAADAAELLRRDESFISYYAEKIYAQSVRENGALPLSAIAMEHTAIASRLVLMLYERSADADAPSLEQVHVEDVLSLCEKGVSHSSISLPAKMTARIEDRSLVMVKKSDSATNVKTGFDIEARPGENFISQINAEIIIGKTQSQRNIYKKSIQITIDSAKIEGTLRLRERREGDRILLGGMHKSLKKLMCDKKIPLDERYRLPIICDGDKIAAVPFVGISDTYSIKKEKKCCNALTIIFYLY